MLKYISLFILSLNVAVFGGETDDVFRGKESSGIRQMNQILIKNTPEDSNVVALDLILETKGLSAARKAQDFIKKYPVDAISTWMLLVLADYYSINGKTSLAYSLLDKAKTRDDIIINDVYYQMIESRLSGFLISSPGLKQAGRNNTLVLDLESAKASARSKKLISTTDISLPAIPNIIPDSKKLKSKRKYHLQVGAFSDKNNILKTTSLFKNNGYPVSRWT